jgi:gas vesicle protein
MVEKIFSLEGVMAENNNGTGKGVLMGFMAGTVVGAVLALLYAPKSGRELRADIQHKTGELKDQADEYLRSARMKAVDIINEGKQRSEQLVSDAKKKADKIIDDANKVISDIRERTGTVAEEAGKVKSAFRAGVDAYKSERSKS